MVAEVDASVEEDVHTEHTMLMVKTMMMKTSPITLMSPRRKTIMIVMRPTRKATTKMKKKKTLIVIRVKTTEMM